MKNLKLMLPFLFLFLLYFGSTQAQNVDRVKSIVKELSSKKYHGRCYTHRGAEKAGKYIQSEFEKSGLQPVNGKWKQPFSFDLNQIIKVKLKIDGQKLIPGADYVVRRNSPGIKGNWDLTMIEAQHLKNPEKMASLIQKIDLENQFMVVDLDDLRKNREMYDSAAKILFGSAADKFILLQEDAIKDYVVYGRKKSEKVVINIRKQAFNKSAKKLELRLKTEFNNITTNNVMGMLQGKAEHDSIIIVCGHYDHLGEMGPKAFYPGADDNASSTAAMIELAHFLTGQKTKPEKSILFVGFSGEEAGLIGSKYFTENLPIAESRISYVINMDMIGFGKAGLQVWNGKNEPRLVKQLKTINNHGQLVDTLIIKENTPNSDHYYFTEHDIPAIFLSTGLAPSKHYHTVYDTFDNTDFGRMKEIIQLVAGLVNTDQKLSVKK
ncbi:MAG TPA: M28 family peptidase [Salinivirga sp.]|uniref:M28 family metallopeptidase n=1 Tax=Salinivirga sp. TaxID=1970192 RepID=UPI002B497F41|nr:M28 family peptidase [Salinivirga sp.]HKK59836.1 M28 family peptidase [Salinivirga sp.]